MGELPKSTLKTAHCRQTDGKARVIWQTEPVPKTIKGSERQLFRFAGGLGHFTQPSGKFDLKLNGKKVLEFNVLLNDHVWSSSDGAVQLSYQVKENSPEDSNGIFTIDVLGSLLKAGEPATFEVVGSATGSLRWFGIYLPSEKMLAHADNDSDDNLPLGKQILDDRKPSAQRESIIQKIRSARPKFLRT